MRGTRVDARGITIQTTIEATTESFEDPESEFCVHRTGPEGDVFLRVRGSSAYHQFYGSPRNAPVIRPRTDELREWHKVVKAIENQHDPTYEPWKDPEVNFFLRAGMQPAQLGAGCPVGDE